MSAGALVVTYHAVEDGPPPLCIDAATFEAHLQGLAAAEAIVLTASELAAGARSGTLPERAVALTFDDGFASAGRVAAPLLEKHGFRATVFAVVDHLGGENDWATQPASAPRRPLLTGAELTALAAAGWEIGSHSLSHRPLVGLDTADMREELVGSRGRLAAETGADVRAFAFPYGVVPAGAAALLEEAGYTAGLAGGPARVDGRSEALLLPRVDAHYLRHVSRLRAAVEGRTAYLRARAIGARARRTLRADHA